MRFRDVSIKIKLGGVFTLLILLTVLLAWVSLNNFKTVKGHLAGIILMSSMDETLNEDVRLNATRIQNNFIRYQFIQDEASATQLSQQIDTTLQGLEAFIELAATYPEIKQAAISNKESVSSLQGLTGNYQQSINEVTQLKLVMDGLISSLIELLEKTMEEILDPAKARAAAEQNIESMLKWGSIDEQMNEAVIANSLKLQLAAHDYSQVSSEANKEKYLSAFRNARTGLEEWRTVLTGEQLMEQAAQKVEELFNAYESKGTRFTALSQTMHENEDELNRLVDQIQHNLEALMIQKLDPVKEGSFSSIILSQERSKSLLLFLSLVVVLSSLFFSYALLKIITTPITKGVKFAQIMSQGDLSQTLDVDQKDEMGMLAHALNEMCVNLRNMFSEITSGVKTMSSSSTKLSEISTQMSSGAEDMSMRSESVAVAAEEMSVNMDSVAAASEETSVNVNMVASAAEEMSATISEIASNTEKTKAITETAVAQSTKTSKQINELGSAAREIGKVTETITEISEQTNLLALNATIEAARAGDAGKGFAVVANEIKDLAKQTSEATTLIKDKITGIQQASSTSVTDITLISEIILEISEMVASVAVNVDEQSNATQEIAMNVSQASEGIQEVNQNVAQASSATGEIASDITGVSEASSQLNRASGQVNSSADELNKLADQLADLVGQFKV